MSALSLSLSIAMRCDLNTYRRSGDVAEGGKITGVEDHPIHSKGNKGNHMST